MFLNPQQVTVTLLEHYMLDGASNQASSCLSMEQTKGVYDSRGAQVMVWDRPAASTATTAPDPKATSPAPLH